VSVARLAGAAFPGTHGQRAKDLEEPARGEDRRRRKSAARVRRGAGPFGRVHLYSKIQGSEVKAERRRPWPLWTKDLAGKKIGTMELADDVFAAKVNSHLLH